MVAERLDYREQRVLMATAATKAYHGGRMSMYTGNLDSNLFWTDSFDRKNLKMEPGEKGCRRGTGAEKQRCFAQVDHV